MATQKSLYYYGTPIIFADHATDFDYPATDPLAANIFFTDHVTPTEVQMNLSVIAAAAMWQSAKTGKLADNTGINDHWPVEWVFGMCMEQAATPAAGGTWDLYWNGTANATAGSGNSGGCSGTDAAYTAAGLTQLEFIGGMTVRNVTTNIQANVGVLSPKHLYGSLVAVNNTSVGTVADADADNCFIVATPRLLIAQAAV